MSRQLALLFLEAPKAPLGLSQKPTVRILGVELSGSHHDQEWPWGTLDG